MTQYRTIETALKRGPKKGLTAYELTERTGISLNSVRATLQQLKVDGKLEVISVLHTGTRGRPQNVYRLA